MIRFILLMVTFIAFNTFALTPGAEQPDRYLPLLAGKKVSLVVNHTARVNDAHLLDVLLREQIEVVSVMSPEHGFRGNAAAGQKIADGIDAQTGLPVHSLYGSTKKPTAAMLSNVDTLVFDIQDVGTRFYTYLSTLHYVLEAAAENDIDVIVLDRPNPHIEVVDGPLLDPDFQSFVGMHPIPVLHGMTLGELAAMIKGEGWIDRAETLKLSVIPVNDYYRDSHYSPPLAPSPNLPNALAIALYPSLCFFEGTAVSIGRGTPLPFQLIGHDNVMLGPHRIAVSATEAAPHPKLEGTTLGAQRFELPVANGIDLDLLITTYQQFDDADQPFFTRPDFFDKLAGTDSLRHAILAGESAAAIRARWQAPLNQFKAMRAPYLLYDERAADAQ